MLQTKVANCVSWEALKSIIVNGLRVEGGICDKLRRRDKMGIVGFYDLIFYRETVKARICTGQT